MCTLVEMLLIQGNAKLVVPQNGELISGPGQNKWEL